MAKNKNLRRLCLASILCISAMGTSFAGSFVPVTNESEKPNTKPHPWSISLAMDKRKLNKRSKMTQKELSKLAEGTNAVNQIQTLDLGDVVKDESGQYKVIGEIEYDDSNKQIGIKTKDGIYINPVDPWGVPDNKFITEEFDEPIVEKPYMVYAKSPINVELNKFTLTNSGVIVNYTITNNSRYEFDLSKVNPVRIEGLGHVNVNDPKESKYSYGEDKLKPKHSTTGKVFIEYNDKITKDNTTVRLNVYNVDNRLANTYIYTPSAYTNLTDVGGVK